MSDNVLYPFAFNGITVRAFRHDGNVWFVANDVGKALGINNIRELIRKVLRSDERMHVLKKYSEEERAWVIVRNSDDLTGGRTKLVVINESGLYTVVMRSTRPRAVEFRHWVTSEVLPSIRETGSYSIPHSNQTALPSVLPQNKESEQAIEIHRGKSKKFISLTTPKMTLEVPANPEGYDFIHEILRDYL